MKRTTEADIMKFRRRHERLHRGKIRKALDKSVARFWAMVISENLQDAVKLINTLIDPEPVEKAIKATISETSKTAARKTGTSLKSDFDIWFDPILLQYLDSIMFEKVTGIMESTRVILQRFAISYANQLVDQAINPDTLARQFRNDWEGLSRMRSLRIARTEVASAANFGQLSAVENSDVVETKTWNAVFKNTRDQHQEMHGTKIGKGESFTLPNGDSMRHPLDFNGSAENVVNCQCYLTFD